MDVQEKILKSTIKLIREKGFKGATTRAIALHAGVNEVTIFRHFDNKIGLLKALVERLKLSYIPAFSEAFEKNIVWDLEQDLYMIAKLYQKIMNQNIDFFIIIHSFEIEKVFPELEQDILSIPQSLKNNLSKYFKNMKAKGKLLDINPEAQAATFMLINFGYFYSNTRHNLRVINLTEEEFLKNSIKTFTRGLMP